MPQVSESDTNQPQEGGDALDDFDVAMSELTASSGQAPADNAAADGEGDPDQGSKAAEDQPGSNGSQAEEAGKNDQAAGSQPPDQKQSDDIWANAPPELREAHQRELASWNHRLSSTQGRLSVADRELARLRREAGATPEGQSHSEGGGSQQQADNPFESEQIKALREEYGEVAGPILDLLEAQNRKLAALEAPVAVVSQQQQEAARHSEISIFTTAHPDWEKYVTDERYQTWLDGQPKAVQEAASRAVNVEDGQEAAWLLTQFKASIGVTSSAPPVGQQDSGNGNRQPAPDPKRARQLAAGRDGGSSAPPVQSGVPDDFDGAFDAIVSMRERQKGQQGQYR